MTNKKIVRKTCNIVLILLTKCGCLEIQGTDVAFCLKDPHQPWLLQFLMLDSRLMFFTDETSKQLSERQVIPKKKTRSVMYKKKTLGLPRRNFKRTHEGPQAWIEKTPQLSGHCQRKKHRGWREFNKNKPEVPRRDSTRKHRGREASVQNTKHWDPPGGISEFANTVTGVISE